MPLNISLLGFVRLSDVFIIISVIAIVLNNPTFKTESLIIFSAFYIVLLFSDLLSLWQDDIRYTGIAFYYKYSLIFIMPYIVSRIIINRKRLLFLVKILYLVYLFLVIWVYIYYVLRVYGLIQGNPRVSYPFSDYYMPDACLFFLSIFYIRCLL